MIKSKLLITAIAGLALCAGCNKGKQEQTTTSAGNPVAVGDVKSTVDTQLSAAGLTDVKVEVDRDRNLITLRGDVKDDAAKARAEQIARDNATTLQVANEIGVRPDATSGEAKEASKNLDSAIEDNFKASLVSHKLNHAIRYKSVNQTLELNGSVKSNAQRAQLEQLAKSVPNVKEVVNKIEVK